MKLYALWDKQQELILAIMHDSDPMKDVIGAINPKTDGNYYKELLISGVKGPENGKLGLIGWMDWAMVVCKVSEDFPFSWADIVVREIEL